jgi:thiamine-phosphate diphosphorylase
MLVTDGLRLRGRDTVDVIVAAIEGGVNIVQLRERSMPRDELIGVTRRVVEVTRGRAHVLVNSDVDAAVSAGADGVHLPEAFAWSPVGLRKQLGEDMIVSVAAHGVDAALQADARGADLVVLGGVFASNTHPAGTPLGLDGLHGVSERLRIPVVGIGGITSANAGYVILAGAAGVAVIGAILDADDPRRAAEELRVAVQGAVTA